MNPKISIITVVYNGAKFLEQAIQSVLGQTYTNIEYIIIDGGSKDGTLDIIRKYDDRIFKWVSEPDRGIYDAMNKGITFATGELIGILNADDWYEPDAVTKVVNVCEKYSDGEVFHGLLKRRDIEGNLKYIIGQSSDLLPKTMIEHPTCFVKKTTYQRYGLFDTSMRIAGDYELMLRLKKHQVKFVFIEEVLANFRDGGVSNSFKQVKETLTLKYNYGFISGFKKNLLLLYFGLKRLLP